MTPLQRKGKSQNNPLRKSRSLRPKKESTLKKNLDDVFSKFIRQRDADKNGMVRCCSCGTMLHWKDSDASHFVSRKYLYTRYDERNVHASCRKCNRFLEGNKEGYSLFLINKYGATIFAELNEKKWLPYPNFPYISQIDYYKRQLETP